MKSTPREGSGPVTEPDVRAPATPPDGSGRTYSARLIRPFLGVLKPTGLLSSKVIESLEALDLDERLPVEVAHQMLEVSAQLSGNPAIGLLAARSTTPTNAGAVNYVISSAATVRAAIDSASRYMRLVNDAVELTLSTEGDEARLRFDNRVPMSRAALDFQIGAMYRAFWCVWATGAHEGLRVLIPMAAPDDESEYQQTFPGAALEFDAPFGGFVFSTRYLDERLSSGETRLHEMISSHAERMLQELPRAEKFTDRVRGAIAEELSGGNPSVAEIARHFHMSPRTLERKLEREATTFSALLDDLRRRLALRYVGDQELELAEIAFLLGFAQTTGFHRAFKRWTGCTPLDYRRGHRGG